MGIFDGLVGSVLGGIGGILGSNKDSNTTKDINSENAALSREYAQSGIQWRVADAKKAGISAYGALGIPLQSSPTLQVGSTDNASVFSNMGQGIGRAVDAVRTAPERKRAQILEGLQLERASLENELLRSQITNVQRASNPALPGHGSGSSPVISGQADSLPSADPFVDVQPAKPTAIVPGNPGREPGLLSDYGFYQRNDGKLGTVMSNDMKQRTEDDLLAEVGWHFRNKLLPYFGFNQPAIPPQDPGKGRIWFYRNSDLSYESVPINSMKGKVARQQYKRYNR